MKGGQGEWLKRSLGGETQRNKILIAVLAFSVAVAVFSFLQEHAASKEKDLDLDNSDTPKLLFATEQDQENRQRMLKNVRSSWIEGVLHKSLWNEARILLNLTAKPDVVVRPCDLAQRRAGGTPDTPIAPGTKIITVYEQESEELLILGDPGSGKTTLLLEITEELLNRAEVEPNHPIPVVFGLSAWRTEDKELTPWLVKQLNRDYGVPEKIGKRWVESGALLLLLDGLDEVAENRRAKCVEAINAYRTKYQSVLRPMVVCCRTREYETIPDLRLHGAVVIQPLTPQQVDGFLKEGGVALEGLRTVLEKDYTLYHELFENPLMLNIAIITFENQIASVLKSLTTQKERREMLWNKYVEKSFERKLEDNPLYDKENAIFWLGWLSSWLVREDFQIYYIESMQPKLLMWGYGKYLHRISLFALSWCIPLFFIKGASLIALIITCTVFSISNYSPKIQFEPLRKFNVANISRYVVKDDVDARNIISMFCILGIGYFLVLLKLVYISVNEWFVYVLSLFVLFFITLGTVFFEEVVSEKPQKVNEGVLNSLMVSSITSVVFMVLGYYLLNFPGLVGGALGGWLNYGGRSIFQHYLLRFLLWCSKRFPYQITPFLDWCVERILLQRVGGGWRFIHRSLQEHFAERYYEKHPEERQKEFEIGAAVGKVETK